MTLWINWHLLHFPLLPMNSLDRSNITQSSDSEERTCPADEEAGSSRKRARSDVLLSVQRAQDPKLSAPEMVHKTDYQRYLLTIEYIGTSFVGWQKQKQTRTVQGVLEEAFHKFVGKPVESAGSSRTDKGVHALGNVCHVDVQRVSKRKPGEILHPHEPLVVKRAINHFLQEDAGDISVLNVRCVPPDFHCRFNAKERIYYYRILAGTETISIFERGRAWHVQESLDIVSMQQACQFLIGHHDFSSFRAAGCQANSPFRTLDELHVCFVHTWPHIPSEMGRDWSIGVDLQGSKNSGLNSSAVSFDEIVGIQADANMSSFVENQSKEESMQLRDREAKLHHVSRKTDKFAHGGKLQCIVVKARARSFLYHQVRLMVGLLKAVGTGALQVADAHRILEARSVIATPTIAPAHGLYLANVKYDFDRDDIETQGS